MVKYVYMDGYDIANLLKDAAFTPGITKLNKATVATFGKKFGYKNPHSWCNTNKIPIEAYKLAVSRIRMLNVKFALKAPYLWEDL